jgi:hypothetical protein
MKSIIFTLTISLLSFYTFSQVGINTDNTPPHPSAQLDVKNPNKGLLLPRVTSPATAIAGPAAGLVVYDQANANLAYYNGANWSNLTGTAGNEGLYSRFPNSKSFTTYYNQAVPSQASFDFVVPAGVTKLWVEAWGGGDVGTHSATGVSLTDAIFGGPGGDFASFLLPVTAGNTMDIKVSKGWGFVGGISSYGTTQIYPVKTVLNYVNVGQGGYQPFQQIGTVNAELIQFFGGESFISGNVSYDYNGSLYTAIVTGADGGGSYPTFHRTKSNTLVFNANTNALITLFGNSYFGTIPGGGAPAGTGNGNYGGPGMVIVHW